MKKILYIFLTIIFICNIAYAKPLNEMSANTNPDITNDLIYSQDVSDTTEASTGTGKSLTIKNALKAAKINVDGTNVGINTVGPTQQLEVVGTVKATAFIGDGSGLTGVSGSSSVSDSAYGSGWNGDTTTAPSKNAVYDKIQTISGGGIYYNIVTYGAIADGVTDNTTAIQDAFDAATINGGTVYIPAGTYLTGQITTYKNVSILGDNKASSILKAKAGTTNVIYYSDTTTQDPNTNSTYLRANLEKFQVDCNSTGSNGINITRAPIGSVDNIAVYNCATGVKWDGNWISVISNSSFRFNEIGLSTTKVTLSPSGAVHEANLLKLQNVIFRENTSWGVVYQWGASLVCDVCDFERNGTSGDSTTGALKMEELLDQGKIGLVMKDSWFESNWGRGDIYINTPTTSGITATIDSTYFYTSVPSGTKVIYNIDAPSSLNQLNIGNSYFETPSGSGHINTAGSLWNNNNTFTTTPLVGGGTSRSVLYNRFNINSSGSGNVGLGSTSPTATLDVVGTGKFSSTLSASSLTATALPSGQCVETTTGGLFTTTGSACGSGGGGVGIGTVNPGNAGYISYYPSSGTTVDDLPLLYTNGTNIGIGTTGTTNTISFSGSDAKSIGVLRNPSSASGNDLTINAGGGTSGGTDLNGGSLILQPGQATGLGIGSVRIRAPSSGTSSGSSENVPVDRLIVTSGKTITEDVASDLFSIDIATGTSCGGTINWSTANTDGTEFQIMAGLTTYAAFNKAGTIYSSITENVSNEAKILSSGTLTNTFQTDASGTTFKIQVIHNSSLTPSAGHPRINYNVNNNCYKDVTIL